MLEQELVELVELEEEVEEGGSSLIILSVIDNG